MNIDIQLREIFHFCFLERLLKISDPKLYVLKGGVNLRFFFHSPRYSEDMDLDVLVGNVTTLKKNGYKILSNTAFKRSLRTYGIDDIKVNDPAKAKQRETTQRFRVRLITPSGDSLPTKVEFSRRKGKNLSSSVDLIDPEIARTYKKIAFRCQHYPGELAAIQKIEALAGRSVAQARDVFDLGILHAGGFANPAPISAQLSKQVLNKAQLNLVSLSYEDYRGQVLEFLDDTLRERYESPEYWEALQNTVLGLLSDGV
jgi:predicted nucleotidyltransferase component of viral defense system